MQTSNDRAPRKAAFTNHELAAQLAQREQYLAGIVNNVVDGVITIDESGNVWTLNPAAEQMFGYKAEEVIGHNVSMLMLEPYRSEHDTYVGNYLRMGEGKIIGRKGRVLPAQTAPCSRWIWP